MLIAEHRAETGCDLIPRTVFGEMFNRNAIGVRAHADGVEVKLINLSLQAVRDINDLMIMGPKGTRLISPWQLPTKGIHHLMSHDSEARLREFLTSPQASHVGHHAKPSCEQPATRWTCAASGRARLLVKTAAELNHHLPKLLSANRLGLDVETEIYSPRLCLIQMATETETFIVDPLAIADLSMLRPIFETAGITKVIHNSPFERRILGHVGFQLQGVYDTLTASRKVRGYKLDGGHSLAVVCRRELGISMSKELQCSDWARRPLTVQQLDYAALDAEVLLRLQDRFSGAVCV